MDERSSQEETADHWWFAYPLSVTPQKSSKREIFTAECEFSEMLEEVLDFLVPLEGMPPASENPRKASELYRKFTDWKLSLPADIREEKLYIQLRYSYSK